MANVQVWQSQLMRNDFPPVCVMTGAPAETWRRFTFTNTPPWAFAFGAIGAAAFSQRVTGYLPMTKQVSKRINTWRWIFLGLIPVAIVLWVAGGIVAPSNGDATQGTIAGLLFFLGIVAILAALIGAIVARSVLGPRARITEVRGAPERLIELRRVHPAFVAAVQQLQQARAAEIAQAQQAAPPSPPDSPFPPGKFSF